MAKRWYVLEVRAYVEVGIEDPELTFEDGKPVRAPDMEDRAVDATDVFLTKHIVDRESLGEVAVRCREAEVTGEFEEETQEGEP